MVEEAADEIDLDLDRIGKTDVVDLEAGIAILEFVDREYPKEAD